MYMFPDFPDRQTDRQRNLATPTKIDVLSSIQERQVGLDRPRQLLTCVRQSPTKAPSCPSLPPYNNTYLCAGGADVDALAVLPAVAVDEVPNAAVGDLVVADVGPDDEVLDPHTLVAVVWAYNRRATGNQQLVVKAESQPAGGVGLSLELHKPPISPSAYKFVFSGCWCFDTFQPSVCFYHPREHALDTKGFVWYLPEEHSYLSGRSLCVERGARAALPSFKTVFSPFSSHPQLLTANSVMTKPSSVSSPLVLPLSTKTHLSAKDAASSASPTSPSTENPYFFRWRTQQRKKTRWGGERKRRTSVSRGTKNGGSSLSWVAKKRQDYKKIDT